MYYYYYYYASIIIIGYYIHMYLLLSIIIVYESATRYMYCSIWYQIRSNFTLELLFRLCIIKQIDYMLTMYLLSNKSKDHVKHDLKNICSFCMWQTHFDVISDLKAALKDQAIW